MSTRQGDNKKKGQKYQNSFTFKHNVGSMKTRKIKESPLDFLCTHCFEVLQWKINYRKYKPLTVPATCNICHEKTIYKAYRTICDSCAVPKKLCTKCVKEVEEYNKETNLKKKKKPNDFQEVVNSLKQRYKNTVERKMREGIRMIFDQEKGIIDKETGEIIVDIVNIDMESIELNENNDEENEDNENEDNEENDGKDCDGENEINPGEKEKKSTNNNIKTTTDSSKLEKNNSTTTKKEITKEKNNTCEIKETSDQNCFEEEVVDTRTKFNITTCK